MVSRTQQFFFLSPFLVVWENGRRNRVLLACFYPSSVRMSKKRMSRGSLINSVCTQLISISFKSSQRRLWSSSFTSSVTKSMLGSLKTCWSELSSSMLAFFSRTLRVEFVPVGNRMLVLASLGRGFAGNWTCGLE